jgi:hypothetical protein
MKSDYIVQFGVNFSHMTEFKVFKLYSEAKAFFNLVDKSVNKSVVCYKQGYSKIQGLIGYYADSNVEYKLFYFEQKDNMLLLDKIKSGIKFVTIQW